MFGEDGDIKRTLYLMMAGLAGSVTALAFMDYKNMDRLQICMTVFAGFSFAVFLVPLIASSIFHIDQSTLQVACGITYFGGLCAHAVMPPLIRRAQKWAKGEEPKP